MLQCASLLWPAPAPVPSAWGPFAGPAPNTCWRPAVFPSFKQHAMSRESSLQDQRRRVCKGVSRQDKRRRKGGARTEASIWLTMRKDMSIVQVGSAGSPMEPRQGKRGGRRSPGGAAASRWVRMPFNPFKTRNERGFAVELSVPWALAAQHVVLPQHSYWMLIFWYCARLCTRIACIFCPPGVPSRLQACTASACRLGHSAAE